MVAAMSTMSSGRSPQHVRASSRTLSRLTAYSAPAVTCAYQMLFVQSKQRDCQDRAGQDADSQSRRRVRKGLVPLQPSLT